MNELNSNNNGYENNKNLTFFKYNLLEDMLKVILYSAQSPIGLIPMLYYTNINKNNILFIPNVLFAYIFKSINNSNACLLEKIKTILGLVREN